MTKKGPLLMQVFTVAWFFITLHLPKTVHAFSATPLFASDSTAAAATASSTVAPRLVFPNLEATRFRHPLDRNLTELVQKLPGSHLVEQGIRQVLPIVEQGVRLDLLTSCIKVSPQQLPHIHKLLVEACTILDLTNNNNQTLLLPELYVQANGQANAYTLAFSNNNNNNNNHDSSSSSSPPIVVVTSALLDRFTDQELLAVIGHELGHVKCQHALYLTLGQLAATPWRGIPLVGSQMTAALQQWRKSAEYTCDRAALLVVQNVTTVQTALLKLAAGTTSTGVLQVDPFLAQCQEYERILATANPLVKASLRQQVATRTHPLPVFRVLELKQWSQSQEYLDLLKTTGVERTTCI
jgi:Zn-dependent protease with chaperone function